MGRGGEGGGRNNKKFWGAGIRMLEILFARRGRRETRPKFVARRGTFRVVLACLLSMNRLNFNIARILLYFFCK